MKTLTDQQKLEILCAYLPYGVELMCDGKPYQNLLGITLLNPPEFQINFGWGDAKFIIDSDIRPILRHPDDMTEEELVQLGRIIWGDKRHHEAFARNDAKDWLRGTMKPTMSKNTAQEAILYLHSRLIDTFGAIPSGFAVRKNINEKG